MKTTADSTPQDSAHDPVLPGPEPGTYLVKRRRSVNIWAFIGVGVVVGAVLGLVVSILGHPVPVARSANPAPFFMAAGACLGALVTSGLAVFLESRFLR